MNIITQAIWMKPEIIKIPVLLGILPIPLEKYQSKQESIALTGNQSSRKTVQNSKTYGLLTLTFQKTTWSGSGEVTKQMILWGVLPGYCKGS